MYDKRNFNRLDYVLLCILKSQEAVTKFKGITITEIMRIEEQSARITVYRKLKCLVLSNYVAVGLKDNKADCYYITCNGLELIKEKEEH